MNPRVPKLRPSSSSSELGRLGDLVFKFADSQSEFEQIHRLVYKTFVVEIPQYAATGPESLIDKFHPKNQYIVAMRDEHLRGMVALHDQAPFSVSDALPDAALIEQYCPELVEARLLAVEPTERSKGVFPGLICLVYHAVRRGGYRYMAMSGLRERRAMYERMGFASLGPAIPKGQAYYIPMLLDLTNIPDRGVRIFDRWGRRLGLK